TCVTESRMHFLTVVDFSFSLIRLRPRSTLFPYTTLFRSGAERPGRRRQPVPRLGGKVDVWLRRRLRRPAGQFSRPYDISQRAAGDRKSTRLNSSHVAISYAVSCL